MSDGDGGGVPFGRFRMVGGRYERPGLPVSSAVELSRYERLVKAVAHRLFLSRMQGRRRVPRGFEDRLDLRLVDVQRGSVIPVLERSSFGADMLFDIDWHEEARQLINTALGELNAPTPSLPREFPAEALKEFAQFGRSLDDSEYIELSREGEPPALLTTATRKTIQRFANLDSLEVETVIIGQITGLRSTPQSFDVTLSADGRKMTGAYLDPAMWDSLNDLLGYSTRAPLAALSVVADQSQSGELLALLDVLAVEAALPPGWAERVSELAALGRGWYEEDSEPPSAAAIDAAEELLFAFVDEHMPRPGIFPSISGGVQFEWSFGNVEVELTIDNDGRVEGFVHTAEAEIANEFLDASDTEAILRFLKEYVNGR